MQKTIRDWPVQGFKGSRAQGSHGGGHGQSQIGPVLPQRGPGHSKKRTCQPFRGLGWPWKGPDMAQRDSGQPHRGPSQPWRGPSLPLRSKVAEKG